MVRHRTDIVLDRTKRFYAASVGSILRQTVP